MYDIPVDLIIAFCRYTKVAVLIEDFSCTFEIAGFEISNFRVLKISCFRFKGSAGHLTVTISIPFMTLQTIKPVYTSSVHTTRIPVGYASPYIFERLSPANVDSIFPQPIRMLGYRVPTSYASSICPS